VSKPRILLVDDSSTVLTMERMFLSDENYELLVAHDGEEAIAKAVTEKPDLILLDIVMPGIDGFETCRRLRAQDSTRDTPVIMVTTRGEPESIETGYAAGCNDYVTKPIDGLELLTKIRNCLAAAEKVAP
jgi:DNA-binding response OmpR family regulator